jgi:calcineurin-like phosphoesterase family protein
VTEAARTWFTSDHHFDHRNIVTYCNRPWETVEEMNEALVERWNMRVAPADEVYVLGDFTLHGKPERIDYWLARLNGTKHLIRGNHDNRRASAKAAGWASVRELADVTVENRKLRLFHYPIHDWPGPRLLLHGHCHGTRGTVRAGRFKRYETACMVDVGVDVWGYQPVSLTEILNEVVRFEKRMEEAE